MEHTSHIDELIAKRLTGEIAAEENTWLEQWLAVSAPNRDYFNQMQWLWQQSEAGKQALPSPLDVEAALTKTKAKIQHNTVKVNRKVVPMHYGWMGIAAAILLLVGAFWFFQRSDGSAPVLLAATENTLRDTLMDGSSVALNQHSSLTAEFSSKVRRVKMRGEAYFEVTKNPAKPFIIAVKQVEVTVVGTRFNIDNRSDSTKVIVSVEEGRVKVQSGDQIIYLNAGEQASIDCQSGQMVRSRLSPSSNVIAWVNHQFVFDEVPLSEILPLLEGAYNVQIKLTNKELGKSRLHVRFNNEPIERILNVIAETMCLEVKKENGQYLLDGPGCDH